MINKSSVSTHITLNAMPMMDPSLVIDRVGLGLQRTLLGWDADHLGSL